jgi:hypothetical protein
VAASSERRSSARGRRRRAQRCRCYGRGLRPAGRTRSRRPRGGHGSRAAHARHTVPADRSNRPLSRAGLASRRAGLVERTRSDLPDADGQARATGAYICPMRTSTA